MINNLSAVLLVAATTSLSAGCASHPPPTDHLASAIAAVRGAQVAVAGAGEVPEAALQLKLAEEQVSKAREMIERGENERADFMTLRAYNDAELALALAREHQAQQAAQQASQDLPSSSAQPNQPNQPNPSPAQGN